MEHKAPLRSPSFDTSLAIAIAFVLTFVLMQPAQAQTFTVLHSFTGGVDGAYPYTGLTIDRAGNLYGTASGGTFTDNCANKGVCGTVFKMTHKNSAWIFTPLYNFTGGSDGAYPQTRVIFGPDGSLYGTTVVGGGTGCSGIYPYDGCGTVFNLKPPLGVCKAIRCDWKETVIYRFTGGSDEEYPSGDLVFNAGNIYGTTSGGPGIDPPFGTVYKLTPSSGGWEESVLYSLPELATGQIQMTALLLTRQGTFTAQLRMAAAQRVTLWAAARFSS